MNPDPIKTVTTISLAIVPGTGRARPVVIFDFFDPYGKRNLTGLIFEEHELNELFEIVERRLEQLREVNRLINQPCFPEMEGES